MSVKPIFPYSAMMNINLGQKEMALCFPRPAGKWEDRDKPSYRESAHLAAALLNTSSISVPIFFF